MVADLTVGNLVSMHLTVAVYAPTSVGFVVDNLIVNFFGSAVSSGASSDTNGYFSTIEHCLGPQTVEFLYKIAIESVKGMKVAIVGGVGPFFSVKLIGAIT